MTLATASRLYFEQIRFPDDPALSQLPNLFDPDWVWAMIKERASGQHQELHRIRLHHFNHSIGNSATVSYEL